MDARLAFEVVLVAGIGALALFLRNYRRSIRRAESLRQALTVALVHDLKNPLSSVIGSLNVLREKALDDKDRQRLLDISLKACDAQIQLIENLLEVDRFEGGQMKVRREPLEVARIVQEVLEGAKPVAAGVLLSFENAVPAGLPPLQGDPELLRRTLTNLVHNALKFTPRGGNIRVSSIREPGVWIFKVADTGVGIPAEHLPRLFGKFYRVENGDSGVRGTGLGLYFCKLAIEAQGGEIGVSSEVGKGTTVTFTLPEHKP